MTEWAPWWAAVARGAAELKRRSDVASAGGLLDRPARLVGDRGLLSEEDQSALQWIRQATGDLDLAITAAQSAGMPVEEIVVALQAGNPGLNGEWCRRLIASAPRTEAHDRRET